MFKSSSPPRSQPQPGHLYDVAVIGAGLAGCELAWRLARAGQDVLLVSQALDHLGNLYQPDVSGAEFPADSVFAQVKSAIAPQTDGWIFHRHLKAEMESTAGIHLLQSCVTALSEEDAEINLSTWEGPPLRAKTVVLAVGAFLKGRLLIGDTMEDAGRLSEVAYDFLSEDLAAHGLYLTYGSGEVLPQAGAVEYEVRFQVLAPGELDGFKVSRLDNVYALGRCTPGQHTYASVLEDAAALARQLGSA
ncbi:FAD-binding protein [Deinococcus detaillensis]|uniref:FAD-binding protein n=1 Tax=Deinococcus detaillensis TaxID=2592048 RepID=A0A553V482_9DEIO|nr:FAD-dependent oxidoreductase [Deinococcus detaillensis]TSA87252.1 FAD-binding protein [Deinococcus detaillensis]